MSYGEALRLAGVLLGDPSSQLAASTQGWGAAHSREWWLLADLYDLTHAGLTKHPKPYPRPRRQQPGVVHRGRTAARTRDQVVAILNAHGHDFQEANSG